MGNCCSSEHAAREGSATGIVPNERGSSFPTAASASGSATVIDTNANSSRHSSEAPKSNANNNSPFEDTRRMPGPLTEQDLYKCTSAPETTLQVVIEDYALTYAHVSQRGYS